MGLVKVIKLQSEVFLFISLNINQVEYVESNVYISLRHIFCITLICCRMNICFRKLYINSMKKSFLNEVLYYSDMNYK